MTTTTDLSKYGYREWEMLHDLIGAMLKQGLPKDFYQDEVHPMFNINSGNVFLTNSEYQVCILNGVNLESFYSCPICGHEGFKDELEHNQQNSECQDWISEIKNLNAEEFINGIKENY